MNLLSKISLAITALFTFSSCAAQIKNAKTAQIKILGNCEMCEKTIETSGSIAKVAAVDWNVDNKTATITYDSIKTNLDEILKNIALAGYDNDKFLAPDDAYNKLEKCCQYERVNKTASIKQEVKSEPMFVNDTVTQINQHAAGQLKVLFDNYFALKNSLVKSDIKSASTISKEMRTNISNVKMDKLNSEEHSVWMKILESLKANTENISASSNIDKQREYFRDLSQNFHALAKVSQHDTPIYYQHCPMYNDGKGANWLSKEKEVNNPYYGTQMLNCGKTVEIIK